MSQFYGDLQGQARTKATRRGNKKSGITAHVRGWDVGVRVEGFVNIDGNEVFKVYRTGGSNSSYNKECIAVVEEV